MKKSLSKADFDNIKGQDFVVLKSVNNKHIVGQVSFDKSCIFLSLTNSELSRLAMIPELIVENLGSLVELLNKYMEYFIQFDDKIENSTRPELKEYKGDSLFKVKALYALFEILNSSEKSAGDKNLIIDKAINKALEECIYIQDVQFTLSNYILNRPKQNNQMM